MERGRWRESEKHIGTAVYPEYHKVGPMKPVLRIIIGAAIGAVVGGVVGYFGARCGSG